MKKESKHLIVLCAIVLCACTANSQESIGVTIDNYTPVNGMFSNPSAIVDQKPWLDIHIAGANAHASNNFVYVPLSRVYDVANYSLTTFDLTKDRAWAQVKAEAVGPSASLSLGRHAVALHTKVRAYGNAQNVPIDHARSFLDGIETLQDSSVFSVNNTRVKTMTWGEVGLTYGRILYQFDKHFVTGAITLNRLLGLQGASMFIDEGSLLVNNGTATLLSGNGKYMYAKPAFTAGGGWSGALGFTYKHMISDATGYVPHSESADCGTLPYKWKVMASVVDIGGIKFKRDALYNKFDTTEDFNGFINAATSGGAGLNELPQDKNTFYAWTPASLNVQADYSFENGVFLNAYLVQRLTLPSSNGPEKSNVLALTPRYERKRFMVALPDTECRFGFTRGGSHGGYRQSGSLYAKARYV